MGYTGTWITGSAEDYLREIFTSERIKPVANKGAKYWVLETKDGKRFAIIVELTNRNGYLTYKEVGESMGPWQTAYPLNLLNMLTTTDSELANEWRDKVREYHANRKTKPTLKIGDTVRFASPLTFTNGEERIELVYDGGFRFHAIDSWGYKESFQLNRSWRNTREWEIVAA